MAFLAIMMLTGPPRALVVMRQLGIVCDVHIPNRFSEGYGPNAEALLALRGKRRALLVTVDCGILPAPLAVAETGMDVIVIDHHIAGPELPKAHSVVNPNRLDEDGTYGCLMPPVWYLLSLPACCAVYDTVDILPQPAPPRIFSTTLI